MPAPSAKYKRLENLNSGNVMAFADVELPHKGSSSSE